MMNLRRTKGSTRARHPRRDNPPASRSTVLGLLAVAAMGMAGYLMLRVYNGVPLMQYETAYVSVPTVGNLLTHDAVRVDGTRIGQVLHLDVGKDGRPLVKLQLAPGTKLPADTSVAIRASGLLGARYVALQPGRSRRLLKEGATISGNASSYTYGLPEAVAVFDEQSRGGLQSTVRGLAEGMLGNGAALNTSLKDLGPMMGNFDRLSQAILSRPGATARLLPSIEAAMKPLDATRDQTGPMLQGGIDTLRPVVTEHASVEDALSAAPATLLSADSGLRHGRALLSSVRDLSTAAQRTLPTAPAGLNQLSALLVDIRGPLRAAEPTVRYLLPQTAKAATKALVATEPVVGTLKSGIDTARPILASIGRYRCDVINTGEVLRSMTGFGQTGSGPAGKAEAFRLQPIVPAAGEAAGLTDTTGIYSRDGNEAPCRYLAKPYPQLVPGAPTSASVATPPVPARAHQ